MLTFIGYFNRTMAKPFKWTYWIVMAALQSGVSGKVPSHEAVTGEVDARGAGTIARAAVERESAGSDADARPHSAEADEGVAGPGLSDEAVAEALDVNRSTVERVRIRCVEEGFEAALRPRPSRQLYPRKLDGRQAAQMITLACSPAPAGRARWSLRLLADKLVELEIVDDISHETVRQTLNKTISSRG